VRTCKQSNKLKELHASSTGILKLFIQPLVSFWVGLESESELSARGKKRPSAHFCASYSYVAPEKQSIYLLSKNSLFQGCHLQG
jgi:hypothetical protein